jgi:hypothetical protein
LIDDTHQKGRLFVFGKMIVAALGTGAAIAAARVVNAGWAFATGQQPPNPNDPDIPARSAIGYAVVSTATLIAVQVLVNRFGGSRFNRSPKDLKVKL